MLRVLVTGGSGMLGGSLCNILKNRKIEVFAPTRAQLDLADIFMVRDLLTEINPDVIFHCAASVGGIQANIDSKSKFLTDNYVIDFNLLTSAREKKVRNLAYIGSSCMYPTGIDIPMTEEILLTGSLEKTNESYALSKIIGTKYVEAVREQDLLNWHTFISSNLYGPNDRFSPNHSHLIASIVSKVYNSTKSQSQEIEIWGSGKVRREFTYVEDFANFVADMMLQQRDFDGTINVGYGQDFQVTEFYQFVMDVAGVDLKIRHDLTKPEGNSRKLMDSSRAVRLGWDPKTDIITGIENTYEWFARKQN